METENHKHILSNIFQRPEVQSEKLTTSSGDRGEVPCLFLFLGDPGISLLWQCPLTVLWPLNSLSPLRFPPSSPGVHECLRGPGSLSTMNLTQVPGPFSAKTLFHMSYSEGAGVRTWECLLDSHNPRRGAIVAWTSKSQDGKILTPSIEGRWERGNRTWWEGKMQFIISRDRV